MILFGNRTNWEIRIYWTKISGPTGPIMLDEIGTLRRPDKTRDWIWDILGRNQLYYETLPGTDKRQIIGMLDNLNGVDYRPADKMRERWEKIIGLKDATLD